MFTSRNFMVGSWSIVNLGVAFRRGTVTYGTRNKRMSHAWMYTSPSYQVILGLDSCIFQSCPKVGSKVVCTKYMIYNLSLVFIVYIYIILIMYPQYMGNFLGMQWTTSVQISCGTNFVMVVSANCRWTSHESQANLALTESPPQVFHFNVWGFPVVSKNQGGVKLDHFPNKDEHKTYSPFCIVST